MAQRATNTPTVNEELSWQSVDTAMSIIPEPLRRWIQYEASSPFNPVQIVDVKLNTNKQWADIWSDLLRMSRHDHCGSFDNSVWHNDAEARAQIDRLRSTEPKKRPTIDGWFSSKSF